jgi:hypothetical protein
MNDESIFAAALGKAPVVERRAFLDGACAGDHGLRQRIERLLEADDRTGGTLERGPDGPIDPPLPGERPGDRVAPHKFLQQIGEEAWAWRQVRSVKGDLVGSSAKMIDSSGALQGGTYAT